MDGLVSDSLRYPIGVLCQLSGWAYKRQFTVSNRSFMSVNHKKTRKRPSSVLLPYADRYLEIIKSTQTEIEFLSKKLRFSLFKVGFLSG